MHSNRRKQKKERSALEISLMGSTLFVILEILMALYTSSQALLLDAVYDGAELVMILFSIGIIPLLYKPSNEKRPFGYLQVESLFLVLKGIVILSVTVGLIINNIQLILHGGRHVSFSIVAWFELSATFLSLFVIFILNRHNRNLSSPIVEMEIQEWKIDAVASVGMSVAFFLPVVVTASWMRPLMPYLDQLIAVVLSICMLPVPIRSIVSGLRDLFLLPPEEETISRIKELIEPVLQDYGYTELYYDIVRTGRKLWISVYITFDRDLLSIAKFRMVQEKIIQTLSTEYDDFYFELLPNIEYTGETDVTEVAEALAETVDETAE
ncbi:MAG: cation transporter [Clostridia bacterium]|nr:cation transporter [Clostridia bacterium]